MIHPGTHTLYLAGPMSGLPDFNFPAFDQAREWLRREGFAVLCPAELDRELGFDERDSDSWSEELADLATRRDLRAISLADAVAVLSGFTSSAGARVEVTAARWVGVPIVAAFDPSFDLSSDVDEWLDSGVMSPSLRSFEGLPEDVERRNVSTRRALLVEASELVDGDRNAQYGDPRQDFRRTAELWSVYLDGKTTLELHDVAAMMALLKLSRIRWSPEKRDSWVDLAGYAACGWDTIAEEMAG